ncbi:hypothetical protein D477_006181 [Arthrobacter crystallopoietes BAB-32]|uniref:Uncharacterized protein n=1 Tax=Arthrobacter crystallopoietes BAB-32 TaxID=1246476 RepID=N1UXI7_9MICC|nr:hypothetical protein [Arthrobacter crystallopoietes]EMY35111.1 hypothetical protein D477_006181 [Arthrobacter crystallopoietes BAB-32]
MTSNAEKAPGSSTPSSRRPWLIWAVGLTLLFLAACVYLFVIYGLPLLGEIIERLESMGVRII